MTLVTTISGISLTSRGLNISLNCIKVVVVFYIMMGIIFNYMTYATYVTPCYMDNTVFNTIGQAILNCGLIFNIVLILVNVRINYKNRNFFFKNPASNPQVIYLICFPLIIIILCLLVYCTAVMALNDLDVSVIRITTALGIIVLFVTIISLIIDVTNSKDTGEQYMVNISNALTLSITLVSLWILTTFNVILTLVFHFRLYTETFVKDKCENKITNATHWNYLFNKKIFLNLEHSIIIFTICITPYLLNPLRDHFRLIYRNINKHPSIFSRKRQSSSFFYETIFGILLLFVYFMSFFLYQSSPTFLYKMIWIMLFLGILLFLVIIPITLIEDFDYFSCPGTDMTVTIYDIFLWIGNLGEFIASANDIICAAFLLFDKYDVIVYYVIVIIIKCVENLQSFIQTILLSLTFRFKIDKRPNYLTKQPTILFLVMGFANIFIFIDDIVLKGHLVPLSNEFNLKLFQIGLIRISFPLKMFYRFLSALMFVMIARKQ